VKAAPPLPACDLEDIKEATRELWHEAAGKRFFITGGTGFFGMWLLESFIHINDSLSLGMKAAVLTRDTARFIAKAPHLSRRADLQFITGDIRNFHFPVRKVDYLIHAATEASAILNSESPHEMLSSIVDGTRHLLDFAARAGARKLLFTSSGAVYGRQPPELTHIPETYQGAPDPLLPHSAYGEGKRVAEHLCALHAQKYGFEVKIARCFAFVGPHLPLNAHFAIGNFIRDAMKGDDITIMGDGTTMRSYLYAADLAIWLWTMLFSAPSGRAYNVGSAADLSIADLAGQVREALGSKSAISITRQHDPDSPPERYVPDVSRAEGELGLRVQTSLQEALMRTEQWHQVAG